MKAALKGLRDTMPYATPLEAKIAKKATRAITEYGLIEDGDRVMVGLSGGKDSWALFQVLDVLRKRAPIDFSLVIHFNSQTASRLRYSSLAKPKLEKPRVGVRHDDFE